MRRKRAAAAGLLLGALVLRSGVAHADPDLDKARALFEEAGEFERQGKWPAAQDRLRQALRLRETPQLHYALGWALENDDKLLEAKTEYETALKQSQNRAGSEEANRLSKERLADLDKKMPVIKVHVTGTANGTARVLVDGREIKREDDVATTPVNPGSHVVRVERSGNDEAMEQMAYVGRSTVKTVDIDVGDSVATRDTSQDRHTEPTVRTSEEPKSGGGNDKLVPIVLIGGGGALVIGGIVLLAASSSDASTRDQMQAKWCTATACVNNVATRPETAAAMSYRRQADDATSAGNTKQAVGYVLGGVGLAAAAVGTYLLVTRGRHETASVGAAVLPGGGFANATLRF